MKSVNTTQQTKTPRENHPSYDLTLLLPGQLYYFFGRVGLDSRKKKLKGKKNNISDRKASRPVMTNAMSVSWAAY